MFTLAFARLVYLDIKDAKEFNYLKKIKRQIASREKLETVCFFQIRISIKRVVNKLFRQKNYMVLLFSNTFFTPN